MYLKGGCQRQDGAHKSKRVERGQMSGRQLRDAGKRLSLFLPQLPHGPMTALDGPTLAQP